MRRSSFLEEKLDVISGVKDLLLSAWLDGAATGRHVGQDEVREEGLSKRRWHSMGGGSQVCCEASCANNVVVGRPAPNMLWGSAQRA